MFFNQISLKNPILPRPGILYPRDPPSPEFHKFTHINDVKIHQFPTKSATDKGGSRGYKNIFERPRHHSGDRIIPFRALHTATETPVTRGKTRHSRNHEPLCILYPRDPPLSPYSGNAARLLNGMPDTRSLPWYPCHTIPQPLNNKILPLRKMISHW